MKDKPNLWVIGGALIGAGIAATQGQSTQWHIKIGIILGGAGIGFFWRYLSAKLFLIYLKALPVKELVFRALGIIGGLSAATLFITIFRPYLNLLPLRISLILTFIFMFMIVSFAFLIVSLKGKELNQTSFSEHPPKKPGVNLREQLKILDTSSIIDGRIADLCKTGFLEGVLIIPTFVIAELQKIADSADPLRRNRGRRGLDLLNKIQKENLVKIRVFERDYEELNDVDTKLLRLAKELGAKVVTNDFNLNKVAELYGVLVLNINELSNAIKPVVLPGEEMVVHVIRDGKEFGQGIGYLDDGTMIVVEGGKDYIGLNVDILVTSVLQTAAGRMIFAKPKEYLLTKITS